MTDSYSELFLKMFLESSEFRQLFISNWEKEFFDSKEERIIFLMFKNNWIGNSKVFTKKDMLFEIVNKTKYEQVREKLIEKIEKIYSINLEDYTFSFVRDQFLDILRKKKLQKVIERSVDEISKSGKIDESYFKDELLKSFEIINDVNDLGIDYWGGDTSERIKKLKELYISQFKTGMNDDLDELLKLRRKTLVALSAQLGVGKSLFLNNLAVKFSQDGYNVLYLSLEMDSYDISKRIDKIALNFTDDYYFNRESSEDLVSNRIKDIKNKNKKLGKLFISSYSPRSLTVYQIRGLLERFRIKNIGIDIILVDYLTLMRPNSSRREDNMYMRGKDVSEELRALAIDENALVFTVLQVKSAAYGKNKQGSEMVAESLAIPQNLDTHINMIEIISDDSSDKYFVLTFEKVRDGKKMNKRIYLKLLDNLRIVDTNDIERERLEEMMNKKFSNRKSEIKDSNMKSNDIEMDLGI